MRTRLPRRGAADEELVAHLYATMATIRSFEQLAADLWYRGDISGEYHSSIGEEAVAAGVVAHLDARDAMAVDHRGTGPLIARGVPLASLLLEILGDDRGLCGGAGGHMHLLSKEHLAVSDGIVGAAGPLACGFALTAKHRGVGGVALAFFGEAAVNQGMLMEAFNLAAVWHLPVLFVCKDSGWSITTRSREVTAGNLDRRAASLGLRTSTADGADVIGVWRRAGDAIAAARDGHPAFLRIRVRRPDGHFLDDPFLRPLREPRTQAVEVGGPLVAAMRRPAVSRAAGARGVGALVRRFAALGASRLSAKDPLRRARTLLPAERATHLEAEASDAMRGALAAVEHEEAPAWSG